MSRVPHTLLRYNLFKRRSNRTTFTYFSHLTLNNNNFTYLIIIWLQQKQQLLAYGLAYLCFAYNCIQWRWYSSAYTTIIINTKLICIQIGIRHSCSMYVRIYTYTCMNMRFSCTAQLIVFSCVHEVHYCLSEFNIFAV